MELPEYYVEEEIIEILKKMLRNENINKRTIKTLVYKKKNPLRFSKLLNKKIFFKYDFDAWFIAETKCDKLEIKKLKCKPFKTIHTPAEGFFKEGVFN